MSHASAAKLAKPKLGSALLAEYVNSSSNCRYIEAIEAPLLVARHSEESR